MGDLKKKNQLQRIGRRTGVNIVEGKNIRKEEDGTDVFADYWSESGSDLEQSNSSKSNNSGKIGRNTKSSVSMVRNIKANKNKIANINDYTSNFSNRALKDHNGSSRSNEGTTDDRRELQTIGRRTGVNIVAGKEIKTNEDGIEVFENYWTDSSSELESTQSRNLYDSSVIRRRHKDNVSKSVKSKLDVTADFNDCQEKGESEEFAVNPLNTTLQASGNHNSTLSKPNVDSDESDSDDRPPQLQNSPRMVQKQSNVVKSQMVRKKLSFEKSRSVQPNADRSLNTVQERSGQKSKACNTSLKNLKSVEDGSVKSRYKKRDYTYLSDSTVENLALPQKQVKFFTSKYVSITADECRIDGGETSVQNKSSNTSSQNFNGVYEDRDDHTFIATVVTPTKSILKVSNHSQFLGSAHGKSVQNKAINTSPYLSRKRRNRTVDNSSDSDGELENIENGLSPAKTLRGADGRVSRMLSFAPDKTFQSKGVNTSSRYSKEIKSKVFEDLPSNSEMEGHKSDKNKNPKKFTNKSKIPKMKNNLSSKNANGESQPFEDNAAKIASKSNKSSNPNERLNRSAKNKVNRTSKNVNVLEDAATELDVGTDFGQVATGFNEIASDFDDAEEIEEHLSNRNEYPKETVNMTLAKSKDAANDSDETNEIEITKSNKRKYPKRKISKSLKFTNDIDETGHSLQDSNAYFDEAKKLVGNKSKQNRNSKGRVDDMSLTNAKTKDQTSRNFSERNQIFEDDVTDFDEVEKVEENRTNENKNLKDKVNSTLRRSPRKNNPSSNNLSEKIQPFQDNTAAESVDAEEIKENKSKKNNNSKGKIKSSLKMTKDKQASKTFTERNLPVEDTDADFDDADEIEGNKSNSNRHSKERVNRSLASVNTYTPVKDSSLTSKGLGERNQIFEDSESDFEDDGEIEECKSNKNKNLKEKVNSTFRRSPRKNNPSSNNLSEKIQPFKDTAAEFVGAEEIKENKSKKNNNSKGKIKSSLQMTKDKQASKTFTERNLPVEDTDADFDDADEIEGNKSNSNRHSKERVNRSLASVNTYTPVKDSSLTSKGLGERNQIFEDSESDFEDDGEIEECKSNKNKNLKEKVNSTFRRSPRKNNPSSNNLSEKIQPFKDTAAEFVGAEEIKENKSKKNNNSKGKIKNSLQMTKDKQASKTFTERNLPVEDTDADFDDADEIEGNKSNSNRHSKERVNRSLASVNTYTPVKDSSLTSKGLGERNQIFEDSASDFEDEGEMEKNKSNKNKKLKKKVNRTLRRSTRNNDSSSKNLIENNQPIKDTAADFVDDEENKSKNNNNSKGKIKNSLKMTKDKDKHAPKTFTERNLPVEDTDADFDEADEIEGNKSNKNRQSKERVDRSVVKSTYTHLKDSSLTSKDLGERNQIFEDSASDLEDEGEIEVNKSNRNDNHSKRKLDVSNQPNKKQHSKARDAQSPHQAASDSSYAPEKQKSNSGASHQPKKKQRQKPAKRKAVIDPSFQPRRSSRDRVPPLAIWRNERRKFRYCTDGTIINLGIDPGTKEDTFAQRIPKQYLAKKQFKTSTDPDLPITRVVDPRTGGIVELNLYRPFDTNEWSSPGSDDLEKALYSVSKSHASKAISFGCLNISVAKDQQYSPSDNIHFRLLKGNVVAKIHKSVLTPNRFGDFIVPQGVAYSIKNTGKGNALLSFCSFKEPFYGYQL